MPLLSTIREAGPYPADGAATAFPFQFRVFAPSDVAVDVKAGDGSVTTLAAGAYGVTLNASQEAQPGGTVTISPALASGSVYIRSAIPVTQPLRLLGQGGFNPEVVTAAFDRVVALIQQSIVGVGRALTVAVGDGPVAPLPTATARAGKLLGFDAEGDPIAVTGAGTDAALRSDLAATSGAGLVGVKRTATGTVSRSVARILADRLHASEFGVDPTNTDNTAALNAFFAHAAAAGGGELVLSPGQLDAAGQINIAATPFNRTLLHAAGTRLRPTHGGKAVRITGGSAGGGGLTISGLVLDVQGNDQLQVGFENAGALYTDFQACSIEYDVPHPSLVGWVFKNLNPAVDDTGSFWCRLSAGTTCRQRSGATPRIGVMVSLRGQANAFVADGVSFQNADVGVLVEPETGYTSNSNGVRIHDCAFEGLSRGVWFKMHASGSPDSLVVTNNRVEAISDVFLAFSGTNYGGQQHPFFAGNGFAVSTVNDYISCLAGMDYTSFDTSLGSPNDQTGMARFTHNQPFEFRSTTNIAHLLKLYAPTEYGLQMLAQAGGATIGEWLTRASVGTRLRGTAGNPIFPTHFMPPSSSAVEIRNMPGTATFAGETTKAVVFAATEADAAYQVVLSPECAGSFHVTAKTTAGFAITAAAAATGAVGWGLRR